MKPVPALTAAHLAASVAFTSGCSLPAGGGQARQILAGAEDETASSGTPEVDPGGPAEGQDPSP